MPCIDPGHIRSRALETILALVRIDVGDDVVDLCAGQVELGHRWVGIPDTDAGPCDNSNRHESALFEICIPELQKKQKISR